MEDTENLERENQKILFRNSLKRLGIRLLLLFILMVFGGFLFRWSEGMRELEYKCGVKKVRRDFLDSLWSGSQSSYMKEDDWKSLARRRLLKFEDELHNAFEAGITSYSGQKSWSFLNSVFYSLTIMTTIGYGHISPGTSLGKILTIIYALITIPIYSIILGDAGRVFTRGLKLYLTRKDPKALVDDEFNLPLQLALLILFLYTLIGTIFFYFWESDWGFLGSIYFVFISTSTIGFGDLVPSSPIIAILFSIYFLFGLALTGSVIGLIQEKFTGILESLTNQIAELLGISAAIVLPPQHPRSESECDYYKED